VAADIHVGPYTASVGEGRCALVQFIHAARVQDCTCTKGLTVPKHLQLRGLTCLHCLARLRLGWHQLQGRRDLGSREGKPACLPLETICFVGIGYGSTDGAPFMRSMCGWPVFWRCGRSVCLLECLACPATVKGKISMTCVVGTASVIAVRLDVLHRVRYPYITCDSTGPGICAIGRVINKLTLVPYTN
jgi:hypothetical protein